MDINKKLLEFAEETARLSFGNESFYTDCKTVCKILDEVEISFPEERRFSFQINADWHLASISHTRAAREFSKQGNKELHEKIAAYAFWSYADWGHTSCAWNEVLELGIFGLAERIFKLERGASGEDSEFFSALGEVWRSALRFVKRAAKEARASGRVSLSSSLAALSERPPESFTEALVTILLYYNLHQTIECTPLRTVGRLDELLFPFFKKEEKEAVRSALIDFMWDLDAVRFAANLPFAVCGTNSSGESAANELTPIIIDAFAEVSSPYVKMHFLVAKSTPNELILRALEMIRDGYNSIVFLSDETVKESLCRLGIAEADAARYHVVGCYECLGDGEIGSTCGAKINLQKALEYVLYDGYDILFGDRVGLKREREILSFEDLIAELERQLIHIVDCAACVSDDSERDFAKIHSSPIYTSASRDALLRRRDVFAGGARYKNSSINALGLATLVDSLAAIKRIVFDERRVGLSELSSILGKNWEGEEKLRLYAKKKCPKYGSGDRETDALARHIVDILDSSVNGRKNTSGGVYRLGLFSIDWRWEWGEHTAASADGRFSGEPLSQNSSASFGTDTQGVASHLKSAAALGGERVPNGSVVDIDLHASMVSGEDGLAAALGALRAYFAEGGFAVHYNVLDAKALTEAKAHPEKYPNLQVRLCGWNVRFSSLSEREQIELIARASK